MDDVLHERRAARKMQRTGAGRSTRCCFGVKSNESWPAIVSIEPNIRLSEWHRRIVAVHVDEVGALPRAHRNHLMLLQ